MAKGKQKRLREKSSRTEEAMDIDDHTGKPTDEPEPMNVDANEQVLKPQSNAGVQKTKAKKRPLRRNQRLRVEKGVERAEAVLDQMEKKVGESEQRGKAIKSRRHDWEDINDTLKKTKAEKKRKVKERKVSKTMQATPQDATQKVDQSENDDLAIS